MRERVVGDRELQNIFLAKDEKGPGTASLAGLCLSPCLLNCYCFHALHSRVISPPGNPHRRCKEIQSSAACQCCLPAAQEHNPCRLGSCRGPALPPLACYLHALSISSELLKPSMSLAAEGKLGSVESKCQVPFWGGWKGTVSRVRFMLAGKLAALARGSLLAPVVPPSWELPPNLLDSTWQRRGCGFFFGWGG